MMETSGNDESRRRQVAVGTGILLVFFTLVICLLVFWRWIPGWVGEAVGTVAGVIATPFFLEASFAIAGLLIVVFLNSWRRKKHGDEFVEVDIKDLPAEHRADSD